MHLSRMDMNRNCVMRPLQNDTKNVNIFYFQTQNQHNTGQISNDNQNILKPNKLGYIL